MVAFTGSVEVGKHIMRRAAENVKKIGLELGGKSPNIVFADADFEAAIDGALIGIFAGTGEVCSAGSRLLVERSIHDRFVGELVSRAMAIKVGDPLDDESEMGPLVSRQQLDRSRTTSRSVRRRAPRWRPAVTGSAAAASTTSRPSSWTSTTPCASPRRRSSGRCWSSSRSTTRKRRVRIANDTIYGLAGAVWTSDITRAIRVVKRLRAGITWVNTYHPTYSEAPWGGYKQSGIGRELGSYGLDEYKEVKQINIDLTDQPMGVYQRGKQGSGSMGAGPAGASATAAEGRAAQRPAPVPRGRDEDGRGLGRVLRELPAVRSSEQGGAAADRAPTAPAGARAVAPPLGRCVGPAEPEDGAVHGRERAVVDVEPAPEGPDRRRSRIVASSRDRPLTSP